MRRGKTVPRRTGPPQAGTYPTTFWDAGETIVDDHPALIPNDLPVGDYSVVLGCIALIQVSVCRSYRVVSGSEIVLPQTIQYSRRYDARPSHFSVIGDHSPGGVSVVLAAIYSVATRSLKRLMKAHIMRWLQHIADTGPYRCSKPGVKTPVGAGRQPAAVVLPACVTGGALGLIRGDVIERMVRNPLASPGDPSLECESQLGHSFGPQKIFRGALPTLAVHLIRFISIVMGAATVALVMRWRAASFPIGLPSRSARPCLSRSIRCYLHHGVGQQ